jgi:hypothetical protein
VNQERELSAIALMNHVHLIPSAATIKNASFAKNSIKIANSLT